MSGLAVRVDLAGAVRDAQAAFESFGLDRFPRAVQFALTGVAIDAVNLFRADIPNVWHAPNAATRDALRYTVDKDLLGKVTTVGEAKAAVFVQDLASTWLKYSFGDGPNTRLPGDVGVEGYFADQSMLRVPSPKGITYTGLGSMAAGGKIPGRDAKSIARLAAKGYQRNANGAGATKGSASWGVFEVKPGDRALSGWANKPGLWARPARVVASVGRKRVARAIKAGKRGMPTTEFTRRDGTNVVVPKVVNADVPRLLFLSTPKGTYQPDATPSWERAMTKAAATMADRLASELADRLEHQARKR